jgi:hypothetical protein
MLKLIKDFGMMKIGKSIFRTLLALLIVISCLPIFALIFIHYFIKGFIAEENKKNEDNSIN